MQHTPTEPTERQGLAASVRRARAAVCTTGVLVTIVVCCTMALSGITDEPLWNLTRDPAAVTHSSAWIGILSNLGVVLWGATITVCCFAAALVRGRAAGGFLVATSALTAVLMADDALMLHENLFPDTFGLPEKAVLAGYGLALAAWLIGFRRTITASNWVVLAAALGCFAASVLADQVLPFTSRTTFVEDVLKFAGISLWLAYAVSVSSTHVRGALARGAATS